MFMFYWSFDQFSQKHILSLLDLNTGDKWDVDHVHISKSGKYCEVDIFDGGLDIPMDQIVFANTFEQADLDSIQPMFPDNVLTIDGVPKNISEIIKVQSRQLYRDADDPISLEV